MRVQEASTGRRDTLKGARLSQGDAPFDGSRYLEVRIADNVRQPLAGRRRCLQDVMMHFAAAFYLAFAMALFGAGALLVLERVLI